MFLKHFYKTISDLNGEAKVRGLSLSELKKQTEILIIDDEEFALLDALLKHEYNLTQKKTFQIYVMWRHLKSFFATYVVLGIS